jgi:hypothetical protein
VIGLKSKASVLIMAFIVFILLAGFQNDLTKPESKTDTAISLAAVNTMKTEQVMDENIPSMSVQYEPRGTNLFVECIVTGVTFREIDPDQKVGKIIISVDGKRYQEARAAAFIIKGLSLGNHRIRLDVADLHNNPLGLKKEFTVNISEK